MNIKEHKIKDYHAWRQLADLLWEAANERLDGMMVLAEGYQGYLPQKYVSDEEKMELEGEEEGEEGWGEMEESDLRSFWGYC